MREKERRERIRTAAGRKGVARNILASPRAPSCVLNHFPVDSAVCSPIIGVSPPGKLLFYSRTTRAPDVPVYRDILRLFLSPFLYYFSLLRLLFACFPSTVSLLFPDRTKVDFSRTFFPPQLPFHRLHAQFCAPARLFRSIRLLSSRVLSIRHPEAAITASETERDREGNERPRDVLVHEKVQCASEAKRREAQRTETKRY